MRRPSGDCVALLADWYADHARPFLEREAPDRLTELDADLERLKKTRESLDEELAVCFLGASGVGKSTLINALIAGPELILPSGGIGPLTAQALTVRKGSEPRFEAHYHGPELLNRLRFALEQNPAVGQAPATAPPDPEEGGAEEAEIRAEIREIARDDAPAAQGKRDEAVKQARLIVTGGQDGDDSLAYLADFLRTAMGQDRKWGTELRPEDEPRLARVRAALALAGAKQPYERRAASPGDREFRADLKEHASGFLAPLIQGLEVVWDSETLPERVSLVDLPGVGIAGDVHGGVTREWIRNRARAVVLVVGKSGLTEADAQLLHSSGFLNRLLYGIENPEADPLLLMVVVTKVDDSAATRYAEQPNAAGMVRKRKRECFAEVCSEAEAVVRDQMRPQLEKAWASNGASEGQARAIGQLLERLEVHPLSAVEYRRALADDEEDRSFLTDPEQSNVPRLLESLRRQSNQRRAAAAKRVDEAADAFATRLVTSLEVVQAQWEEESRASREAGRLKEEFLVFLSDKREEFLRRQGALSNYFKQTLPETIERLVGAAREEARRKIRAYLKEMESAHHMTLRAAVSRGGTYYGSRRVDLPNDFALQFESPIAEVWGKQILLKIRDETAGYASACVQLVDEVLAWATEREEHVQTRLAIAEREAIKADMRSLESIGDANVDELRQRVNRDLVEGISGLIRRECKEFVNQGLHQGLGMRRRTIELFGDLAEQVTRVARGRAVTILQECCREALAEVRAVLDRHKDPLNAVGKAILNSLGQPDRPEDAERRRRILDAIDSILAAAPDPAASPAEVIA